MKLTTAQLLLLIENLWAFDINYELFDFTLNTDNEEFLTVGGDENSVIHDFRLSDNPSPTVNGSEITLVNTNGEKVEMVVLHAPNIEDFVKSLDC